MFLSSAVLNGHDSGLPALITPLSKERCCWFNLSILQPLCKMCKFLSWYPCKVGMQSSVRIVSQGLGTSMQCFGTRFDDTPSITDLLSGAKCLQKQKTDY